MQLEFENNYSFVLRYEQGRKTPPPWLWLPPHGTLAHCPQGILQSERGGGGSERKVGASSLPRNHHQRQSDGRREREETCGETRKGFSAAVRTKKTVEPPRALLSPPLQLSGAHSPPSPPQPAFILQYILRKQRSKTSVVGGDHGCCRRRDERP